MQRGKNYSAEFVKPHGINFHIFNKIERHLKPPEVFSGSINTQILHMIRFALKGREGGVRRRQKGKGRDGERGGGKEEENAPRNRFLVTALELGHAIPAPKVGAGSTHAV